VGGSPPPLVNEDLSLRRFLLPGLFVLALFVTLWIRRPEAPPPPPPQWVMQGEIFGTTWAAKIVSDLPVEDPAQLERAIQEVLHSIDKTMSTYDLESSLSLLNDRNHELEAKIDPDLGRLVAESLDIYKRSGGAFDVTVGPLVNAWGFGPEIATPPSAVEQAELAARVGSQYLHYSPATGLLQREIPGMEIDLSAIAKGYAVDRVVTLIQSAKHNRFLVEIGGEVRAQGLNARGRPWAVGIERPDGGEQDAELIVDITKHALATSGNYRNLRSVDGVQVTHIIDPRSGEPVSHGLSSVSVLADTCTRADGWATALYVLGAAEGLNVAKREGLAALFLTPSESGEGFVQRASPEFLRLQAQSSPETH